MLLSSCSSWAYHWLLIVVASLVVEHRHKGFWNPTSVGFSSCGTRTQLQLLGNRAQAQKLWHTSLVTPQYVGSFWIWDQTCVSYNDRQILYPWAIREASYGSSIFSFLGNLHNFVYHDCTNLYFHQRCRRVPFYLHPFLYLLFIDVLMMAILTSVRWHLILAAFL